MTDEQLLMRVVRESEAQVVREFAEKRLGGHDYAATGQPCAFKCTICGQMVKRHQLISASPCFNVCKVCGEKLGYHSWNTVVETYTTKVRDSRTGCFIRENKYHSGCVCKKCGEYNPQGRHEWDGGLADTCRGCGMIRWVMTPEQADAERYEAAVNSDEGIPQSQWNLSRYGSNPYIEEGAAAFSARMEKESGQATEKTVGKDIKAGIYKFIGSGKVTVTRGGECILDATACIYENDLKLPPFLTFDCEDGDILRTACTFELLCPQLK
jgi:hypothetical protein